MIKIRPSIFETNSSSNDYYNDYDDYYENRTPSHATTHQLLRVILDWDPSVTESRKDEIIRDMETSDILYDIGDLMTFYEDELEEDPIVDDDTITFRFTVYMKVS